MQISKYKSPKLQIVGANLQLIHEGGTRPSKYAASGQLVIICLGGRRRSLNKCVDHLGADDESRRRWRLVIVADCI